MWWLNKKNTSYLSSLFWLCRPADLVTTCHSLAGSFYQAIVLWGLCVVERKVETCGTWGFLLCRILFRQGTVLHNSQSFHLSNATCIITSYILNADIKYLKNVIYTWHRYVYGDNHIINEVFLETAFLSA